MKKQVLIAGALGVALPLLMAATGFAASPGGSAPTGTGHLTLQTQETHDGTDAAGGKQVTDGPNVQIGSQQTAGSTAGGPDPAEPRSAGEGG